MNTTVPEFSQYVGYSVAAGGVVIGAQKVMFEVNKLRAITKASGKKKRRASSSRHSGGERSNIVEFPKAPH